MRTSTFRRSLAPRRGPRSKYVWARFNGSDNAPSTTLNGYDLLAQYRTQTGLTVNLPGITIWRVHIRISITINPGVAAAGNGAVIAIGVVDRLDITGGGGTVTSPVNNPYNIPYMMWDVAYATEQLFEAANFANPVAIIRHYDIKSHRRLITQNETLTLQIANQVNATIATVAFGGQILLRMP